MHPSPSKMGVISVSDENNRFFVIKWLHYFSCRAERNPNLGSKISIVELLFWWNGSIRTFLMFCHIQGLLWRLRPEPNLCHSVLTQWSVPGHRDGRQVSSTSSRTLPRHHYSEEGLLRLFCCVRRALRIWEPGKRGMVMQTKADRESNGLCCNYHPQGGVVATGYSSHNASTLGQERNDILTATWFSLLWYLYYCSFSASLSSADEKFGAEINWQRRDKTSYNLTFNEREILKWTSFGLKKASRLFIMFSK